MKKLIFKKLNSDTLLLFVLLSFSLGTIVWTLQAVNYLDFVTQDGHGFKTYFLYSVFSFPKIINRLIPFVFFASIFLILINYEKKNELIIFWTQGISKINFANRIIYFSIILMIIQIFIGAYISPMSQLKSRMFLKDSDISFFSSLIKEGKFINVVSGLTIFIEEKKIDGSFKNIFIDDSSKSINKITYAKIGEIINTNDKKIFKLYDGKVINKKDDKINVFEFKEIDLNLSEYSTNTILTPKVQETSSIYLLQCSLRNFLKKEIVNFRNCESGMVNEINQELFKRFYKPIYIPVIAIICCFLIILPKNSIKYNLQIKLTFFCGFIMLILSETTLRYSTISFISTLIYLIAPWICFLVAYLTFIIKSKNV